MRLSLDCHSSKYWPCPMLLNFGVLVETENELKLLSSMIKPYFLYHYSRLIQKTTNILWQHFWNGFPICTKLKWRLQTNLQNARKGCLFRKRINKVFVFCPITMCVFPFSQVFRHLEWKFFFFWSRAIIMKGIDYVFVNFSDRGI